MSEDVMEMPAPPGVDAEIKTFVQATEVWVPDQDGARLVLSSGAYGDLDDFAKVSGNESFAKGEGLPGKAWAEARPVVLTEFSGSYFKRTTAAHAAGLTAAVAVPVFAGKTLKAVAVLLCGDDDVRMGAIEVWRAPREGGATMKLAEGYFGAAHHFKWVSEHTEFPRGQGLPGGVWASNAPLLLRDLGSSYGFIRSESAGKAGLTTGLGLPIATPGDDAYVLTLLSARGTPIARRFELWDVRPARAGTEAEAILVDGLCAREGPLWGTERKTAPWHGPIGKVLGSGIPLTADEQGAPGMPQGYAAMVVLPLYKDAALSHIVAWYL